MSGRPSDPYFHVAIVLAAAAAIAGAMLGDAWRWLHYLGKPLATILILAQAFAVSPVASGRYRGAVLTGLVLSLAGDVFLMLPGDRFVPGLASFLLAHLAYCVAFAPGSATKPRLGAFVALAIVAAANLAGLLPNIPPALKGPVLAYVAVLGAMAAFALARAWTPARAAEAPRSVRFAAFGAVAFVVSDSLLAWDRFVGGVPMPALLILSSYWLAQWAIARSIRHE